MTAAQPRPLATATQIAAEVRAGRRSAREVVEQSLARIRRDDEGVRAFVEVRWTQALAEADALDAGGVGADGLLAGVPVAVKDAFDVAGMVTGHGGRGNSTPAAADDEGWPGCGRPGPSSWDAPRCPSSGSSRSPNR